MDSAGLSWGLGTRPPIEGSGTNGDPLPQKRPPRLVRRLPGLCRSGSRSEPRQPVRRSSPLIAPPTTAPWRSQRRTRDQGPTERSEGDRGSPQPRVAAGTGRHKGSRAHARPIGPGLSMSPARCPPCRGCRQSSLQAAKSARRFTGHRTMLRVQSATLGACVDGRSASPACSKRAAIRALMAVVPLRRFAAGITPLRSPGRRVPRGPIGDGLGTMCPR